MNWEQQLLTDVLLAAWHSKVCQWLCLEEGCRVTALLCIDLCLRRTQCIFFI